MTYLHPLGQLRMGELFLLKGGGVGPIAECRLPTLLINSSWKGYLDALISCVSEEWGRWMRSFWDHHYFWWNGYLCASLKILPLSPVPLVYLLNYLSIGVLR